MTAPCGQGPPYVQLPPEGLGWGEDQGQRFLSPTQCSLPQPCQAGGHRPVHLEGASGPWVYPETGLGVVGLPTLVKTQEVAKDTFPQLQPTGWLLAAHPWARMKGASRVRG